MVDERTAYITLALVPGIGPARLGLILAHCHSATGALSAPVEFLRHVPGISGAAMTAIREADPQATERMLEHLARLGGMLLLPDEFPASLRDLPDRPALLFVLGRRELLDLPAVAVVGSRDPTRYGQEVCRDLAGQLARAGLGVVSGMARGLDAEAHAAALEAGGATIGVLGNGLGVIYPAANRELFARVADQGLLVSEYPPGERPHAGSFPRRNRLISGLARVTVVVEAAPGSGALITAGTALEQGREVMAVPGNITSPKSGGTNRLIRDGAAPVIELADILQHYPGVGVPGKGVEQAIGPSSVRTAPDPPADLSQCERRLFDTLVDGPLPLDLAIERARITTVEALRAASSLELRGLVSQSEGRFALTGVSGERAGTTRER
jgi:DNA processing protein